MTWHIDDLTWESYAAGDLGYHAESAVEAHVVACPQCQDGAREHRPNAEPVWEAVRADITRPVIPPHLRWLRKLGAREDDAVVLSASDNLRLPWAIAVGGALFSVILAANVGRFDQLAYLLLAPLVPVLGVLGAYASTDPLRQLTNVTPYSKLRLGLLRTCVTLLVALPALITLSALVPVLHRLAWVWLIPSLALTASALTLLRWISSSQTAVVVISGWAIVIFTITVADRLDQFGTVAAQGIFAMASVLALALLVRTTNPNRSTGGTR